MLFRSSQQITAQSLLPSNKVLRCHRFIEFIFNFELCLANHIATPKRTAPVDTKQEFFKRKKIFHFLSHRNSINLQACAYTSMPARESLECYPRRQNKLAPRCIRPGQNTDTPYGHKRLHHTAALNSSTRSAYSPRCLHLQLPSL